MKLIVIRHIEAPASEVLAVLCPENKDAWLSQYKANLTASGGFNLDDPDDVEHLEAETSFITSSGIGSLTETEVEVWSQDTEANPVTGTPSPPLEL